LMFRSMEGSLLDHPSWTSKAIAAPSRSCGRAGRHPILTGRNTRGHHKERAPWVLRWRSGPRIRQTLTHVRAACGPHLCWICLDSFSTQRYRHISRTCRAHQTAGPGHPVAGQWDGRRPPAPHQGSSGCRAAQNLRQTARQGDREWRRLRCAKEAPLFE